MRALMIAGLLGVLSGVPQASAGTIPFSHPVKIHCGASSSCAVTFPILPANMRWEVKQLACVGAIQPVTLNVVVFTVQVVQGLTVRGNYPFVPISSGVLSGSVYWVTQDEVFIPVAPGQRLRAVEVATGDPTLHFMECTVSGLQTTN